MTEWRKGNVGFRLYGNRNTIKDPMNRPVIQSARIAFHTRNCKLEYGRSKLEDAKKVLQALFDDQRNRRIMLEGNYIHEDSNIP